jgi:demethylmenaquinone methyltransferase/2-methoxy-6-polyprenyl-1,4-benzoquinol methylase
MFDRIAPRYDLLNRLLSLRMDVGWRREALGFLALAPGDVLLDLACGTGDFLALASPAAPGSSARTSRRMLRGRAAACRAACQADAARLPLADGAVTALSCGFALRNFVHLEDVLTEAARVLAPGGRMALLEVDEPESSVMRLGHAVYFNRIVPFVGGLISDRDAYRYLPRSSFCAAGSAIVSRAGFTRVAKQRLSGGSPSSSPGRRRSGRRDKG